jgi:hypothetical protein
LHYFPEPLNHRRGYAVARIFCICFQIIHWNQKRKLERIQKNINPQTIFAELTVNIRKSAN